MCLDFLESETRIPRIPTLLLLLSYLVLPSPVRKILKFTFMEKSCFDLQFNFSCSLCNYFKCSVQIDLSRQCVAWGLALFSVSNWKHFKLNVYHGFSHCEECEDGRVHDYMFVSGLVINLNVHKFCIMMMAFGKTECELKRKLCT